MEATNIYVVRHGETEWNIQGRLQGHLDSLLTPRGQQQAQALAERLARISFTALYSSDLGRALTTAETIGEQVELPVQTDSRLRERNLGVLQGLTRDESRQQFPDVWEQLTSGDPNYAVPEGESARQRTDRSVAFLEAVARAHPGKTLLIIAHGGVLSGLFYQSLGLPLNEPRRFSIPNAAVNLFSINGSGWRLETWGDTAHLEYLGALDEL